MRVAWPLAGRAHARARLRAELHLAAGERVLIRVCRGHGAALAATDRALYWQPGASGWMRLGWEQISQLEEDRGGGGLVVTGLGGGIVRRTVIPLQDNRRLVVLARERIAATRVVLTHLAVDGRELPVEARRQPASGRLHWFIDLDDDLDTHDPELPAKLDQALAELRALLGI